MSRRKLWSVEGNSQRLDGGAMFGNAPRAVWERWIAPDEQNRIPLSCRALLIVEPSGRTVLLETGIGAFFAPKLRERFGVEQAEHVLLAELERAGVPHTDVDVVVLSHLHFDHAGGLLAPFAEGRPPELMFPKARFVVGRVAFERARHPHVRDRASFIPELPGLLEASARLELVDSAGSDLLGPDYRFHYSDGHTPGLLLTELSGDDGPVLFAGDLIPGTAWVHLPITMGYDRNAELLIDEKTRLLSDLTARGGRLFFTHDPAVALARVVVRDGRYSASDACERLSGVEA
ncbi:MAG: MBL fold metallo-hydrolase [Polyangiaceae bacterium]|nr:MBL fold metallo-hydrolase [Polyangiaceae bacterium]